MSYSNNPDELEEMIGRARNAMTSGHMSSEEAVDLLVHAGFLPSKARLAVAAARLMLRWFA